MPSFIIGAASSAAPVLLYMDSVTGSATNGENGKGFYLTLYGLNFGSQANLGTGAGARVYIGGAEVANYRYLVPAVTNGVRPGLPNTYALCVQIGSAGVQALTAGSAYAVSMVVAGQSSNTVDVLGNALQYTPNPGHQAFVDTVNGNDSTAVLDDPTHPFRFFQQANGGSEASWTGLMAGGASIAGYQVVGRGNSGTPVSDQVGYDGRLMRWHTQGGSAPTGSLGSGFVHFTSYPGPALGNAPEDLYIFTPTGGKGGFMGCDTNHARPNANDGQWWGCSNMRSSCSASGGFSSDASNFNLQNSADNTRFVNLDVQWPSPDSGALRQKAAGIVGNGTTVFCAGNYVHNISGGDVSSQENHGIYWDGSNTCAHSVETCFNVITDATTGSTFQCHNQVAGDTFTNHWIHNNFFANSAKYGINVDSMTGPIQIWNNVVTNTAREGIRPSPNTSQAGVNVVIESNTLYKCWTLIGGSTDACIGQPASPASPCNIAVNNNIIVIASGQGDASLGFISDNTGTSIQASRNLYYDFRGTLTSGYSGDSLSIFGDPKFSSAAGADFRLLAGSPALGVALSAQINPTIDLGMNAQPRSGQSARSVGAFA